MVEPRSRPYDRPGRREQLTGDWWRATVSAVRAALGARGTRAVAGALELLGVRVVGQGPTTVAVDGAGGSLGTALDLARYPRRAEAASLELAIGLPAWQLGSLPHERWMARHDAERHDSAAAFLSPWTG